jgi:Rrf2 family protein
VSLKEIAASIDSPTAFTAKILQILVKANIMNSTKGPNGGFQIEKSRLPHINLKQIVIAIDGKQLLEGCVLGFKICNNDLPCPVHDEFIIIRNQLNQTLKSTNLLDTAMDLNLGITNLKR